MAWLLGWLVSVGLAADLRIAVAPFDVAAGDGLEGLGVGLQSMITTDLAGADEVTVVERARLQDLLAEMDLGAKGVLDPATAAKVGKVLGATHVVAGSTTVVGQTMRIDARVSEVATGKVAIAVEKSGEKDAFFELEKAVVTELLAGLGAELTPKERATIGRLHTADFGAFAEFSRAVSLYDADRYGEAVALLEAVRAKDADFKLAEVTLADVVAVRDEATAKARAAGIASAEQAFVARRAGAEKEAALVDALWTRLRDERVDWRDRVTSGLALTYGLAGIGRYHELRETADAFALRRSGELAYQAVWTLVRPKVPEWFPTAANPEATDREIDAMLAWNRKKWFESDNPYTSLSTCSRGLRIGEDETRMLWLPIVARLDEQRAIVDATERCGVDPKALAEARLDLAEAYLRANRIAPATELLAKLSATSTDERFLQRVAAEAKEVAERQADLEAFPVGSVEREILLAQGAQTGRRVTRRELEAKDAHLDHILNYHVRTVLPFRDPFFVDGVPAWMAIRKQIEVATGPRSSQDETATVRHYRDPRRLESYQTVEEATVIVLGGIPRSNGVVRSTFDFRIAKDWSPRQFPTRPADWAPLLDHPTAGILVGLVDLETNPVCDPVDPTKVEPIPATAWGALIRDGELVIARLQEVYGDPKARPNGPKVVDSCTTRPNGLVDLGVAEVIARKPMKRDHGEIVAQVDGTSITASAGGVTVRADLPARPVGFVGWYADGDGYVELGAPSLDP